MMDAEIINKEALVQVRDNCLDKENNSGDEDKWKDLRNVQCGIKQPSDRREGCHKGQRQQLEKVLTRHYSLKN